MAQRRVRRKQKARKRGRLGGLVILAIAVAVFFVACNGGDVIDAVDLLPGVDKHSVTLESNPSGQGQLLGGGSFKEGAEVTVEVIVPEGWDFISWTKGDEVVSETESFSFTVEGETELVANLSQKEYALVASSQGQGSVVWTEKTATHGEEVTAEGVPAQGFKFAHWVEDETIVSEERKFTFAAQSHRNLVAVFIPDNHQVKVDVEGSGDVKTAWSVGPNTTVTMQATAKDGYEFFGWVDKNTNQEVETKATYTFQYDGKPRNLLARFRPKLAWVDGNDILAVVGKQTTLGEFEPQDLVALPTHISPRNLPVREVVAEHLELLWAAAKADGVDVRVVSAYRSYSRQRTLFYNYAGNHGVLAAERFSARPGQSEHQLGTAVDFGGTAVDFKAEFGRTEQGRWLFNNAHKFGFALSYPENSEHITGYIYEPWHFRYIGIEEAAQWKDSGLSLIEYLRKRNQAN